MATILITEAKCGTGQALAGPYAARVDQVIATYCAAGAAPALSPLDGDVALGAMDVTEHDSINTLEVVDHTGYGFTLGSHMRINSAMECIHAALPVGNVYVDRNMVGAVVGVHSFDGERLSGMRPKAGRPRHLHRFATERAFSINFVPMDSNANLLSLADDASG